MQQKLVENKDRSGWDNYERLILLIAQSSCATMYFKYVMMSIEDVCKLLPKWKTKISPKREQLFSQRIYYFFLTKMQNLVNC